MEEGFGRMDEAHGVIQDAIARGMQSPALHTVSFVIALLEGDKAEADRQVKWASEANYEGLMSILGGAAIGAGRLRQGDEYIQKSREIATRQGLRGTIAAGNAFVLLGKAAYGICDPARKAAAPTAVDEGTIPLAQAFAMCGESPKPRSWRTCYTRIVLPTQSRTWSTSR
jgi:hypothetical protein